MKRIKDTYWKIFFSAYWFARDLGERDSPEWNASGFVEFLLAFIMFGVIFIANFISNGDLPYIKLLVVLTLISSIFLNEYIIRSKKIGFKKQIKNYEYLSHPEMKRVRNKILLFTLIFSFAFMIVSIAINNPYIK